MVLHTEAYLAEPEESESSPVSLSVTTTESGLPGASTSPVEETAPDLSDERQPKVVAKHSN